MKIILIVLLVATSAPAGERIVARPPPDALHQQRPPTFQNKNLAEARALLKAAEAQKEKNVKRCQELGAIIKLKRTAQQDHRKELAEYNSLIDKKTGGSSGPNVERTIATLKLRIMELEKKTPALTPQPKPSVKTSTVSPAAGRP